MNHKNYASLFAILCFIGYLLTPSLTFAQTPGVIYKLATNGGEKILDPNGDGYVSVPRTPAGWPVNSRDEGPGFSEITYRPFPALANEPLNDLTTGSGGGHTDLAPPDYTGSTGSPIAAFYNGTHVMFRIRLGGASTASKGYSVLIDTNDNFDNPSRGQTPTSTVNPGFEFEVVLASNFDVGIYDHRTPNVVTKIWSGSVDQFSQRSVAASTGSGNPDYFYDFYVPLSAIPGITADTKLRMSGITITSAQSGLTGSVSDVGGLNFAAYNFDAKAAWKDVINSFPLTSLNDLRNGGFAKIQARAPIVNPTILAGSTSISGTSIEAPSSQITVYRSDGGTGTPTILGTTTVNTDGTWILTGVLGNILKAGDVITATVTPSSKSVSPSSSPVTVTQGICTFPPPPTITGMGGSGNSNRSFIGTVSSTITTRLRVTIFNADTNVPLNVPAFYFTPSAGATTWTTPLYDVSTATNFYATIVPVDASGNIIGCESLKSNQICFRNGQPGINNQVVSITSVTYNSVTHNSNTSAAWADEVPTNLTSLAGTLNTAPTNGTNGYVIVFINAVQQTSLQTPISTTSTTWSISIPQNYSPALKPGDEINVRSVWTVPGGGQTSCAVPSTPSNLLAILATTATPTINPISTCGRVTTLTGTSSEPVGTVLQFYTGGAAGDRSGTLIVKNGTNTPITATVTTQGNWSVSFAEAAGGGIAAGTAITTRAKASGKVRSLNSNVVSSSAATPVPSGSTFTINAVQEPLPAQDLVTINGTAPATNGTTTYRVIVSIAETPYPAVTTTSTGTWSLTGVAAAEVYPGAVIKAIFTSSTAACPSEAIATTVTCRPPASGYTTSFVGPSSVCYNGVVTLQLSGSEKGVSYRMTTNTGELTGASVIGTGSAITLTSGPLTPATTSVSVRAIKINGEACTVAGIGGNRSVSVASAPAQPTSLSSNITSGCSKVSPTITLNGLTANYTYQLINFNTKALIGTAQTVGATPPASIVLSTPTIYTTTTFGVRVTPSGASPCPFESDRTVTVTVTNGPSLTQAVTINKPTPCSGEQVTISVQTEYNPEYTYVIRDAAGNAIGSTFTGTGSIISRTTSYSGGVTTARTFTVFVTGGCFTNEPLNTTVTANPTTAASVTATTGPDREVCGTLSLDGNNASPGVGTWTKTSGPAAGTITNANDPKTTVTGLTSGVYTFRWTIVNSCGGGSSTFKEVKITINCPAEYIVAAPRYASQYRTNDILASATDSDGGIVSAAIISGTLPTWAQLLANGNIVVRSGSAPQAGTYNFTSRTTDAQGRTTDTPLSITVYGAQPTATPLPVELISFTAKSKEGNIILEWATASEVNNSHFEIQRGSSLSTFENIGSVRGNGTSNKAKHYQYKDTNPLPNITYYRLKQVDLDGNFSYSNIVAVNTFDSGVIKLATIYPNPFTSEITISLHSTVSSVANIQLISFAGKVVYTNKAQLKTGVNELVLSLEDLPASIYLIRILGSGININQKVIKKN